MYTRNDRRRDFFTVHRISTVILFLAASLVPYQVRWNNNCSVAVEFVIHNHPSGLRYRWYFIAYPEVD